MVWRSESCSRINPGTDFNCELGQQIYPLPYRRRLLQISRLPKRARSETQKFRRRILDAWSEIVGAHAIKHVEERHIRSWMDDRVDRPEAANGLLKALRGLFAYARNMGHVSRDPSAEIAKLRSKNSEGFHTWTLAELQQFEAHHPIGTKARLAYALLLFLGPRRGEVFRMGRQHVEDGMVRILQPKTRKVVYVPIGPALGEIIAASPCGDLAFLTTSRGKPFASAASFGMQFRKWCDEAGLPQCSAHGLRKAGATIDRR